MDLLGINLFALARPRPRLLAVSFIMGPAHTVGSHIPYAPKSHQNFVRQRRILGGNALAFVAPLAILGKPKLAVHSALGVRLILGACRLNGGGSREALEGFSVVIGAGADTDEAATAEGLSVGTGSAVDTEVEAELAETLLGVAPRTALADAAHKRRMAVNLAILRDAVVFPLRSVLRGFGISI